MTTPSVFHRAARELRIAKQLARWRDFERADPEVEVFPAGQGSAPPVPADFTALSSKMKFELFSSE